METSKSGAWIQTNEAEMNQYRVPAKYLGNGADKRDMSALGREQVLRVTASSDEGGEIN